MITKSEILSGFAVAVLVASSFTTVAPAGSKGEKGRPWVDVHVKLDANGSAAKWGAFDPFSDGTRTGTPDSHVDTAKLKVLDTFGAGFDMQSTDSDSLSNCLT
ncbi:hypothetical protein [Cupriavidus sp. CuC1]|uniref:hypothetical protein n=1 Tax=Cupriavidus sp. CuC1 TaxID=3373131 RepID=UPI0037D0C4A7